MTNNKKTTKTKQAETKPVETKPVESAKVETIKVRMATNYCGGDRKYYDKNEVVEMDAKVAKGLIKAGIAKEV